MLRLLITVAFLISTAGATAEAGEIASAPLLGSSTTACECLIANLSGKPADLTVEFVNSLGNVSDTVDSVVAAGAATIVFNTSCGNNNPHFCRIRGRFSKKKLKAIYCIRELGSFTQGLCAPLN